MIELIYTFLMSLKMLLSNLWKYLLSMIVYYYLLDSQAMDNLKIIGYENKYDALHDIYELIERGTA